MESKLTMKGERLEAIQRYGIADLPHDPTLDEVARLAAQLCGATLAGVSLLEEDNVVHLGRYGFDLRTTPARDLPVRTTVDLEAIHQIPFLRLENEYAPLGVVLQGRAYRSYAGAPLQTPEGVTIGALFVLCAVTRELSVEQIASLEALSHLATTRLDLLMHLRETQRAARTRQRVEAALTVEKNFVAAVLDTVGALVVVFDTEGRIVRFNRYCELLSGYTSAQLIGTYAWERLIPKEDAASYQEQFQRARRGEFTVAFENDWLASDGTRRRISWSTTTLRDAQDQISFIITTGIDVTVQREAETAIRESEKRYREIVEGSLGVVCTHDLSGRILSINQQGAQTLGRRVTEVVGQYLDSLIHPRFRDELQPYFRALRSSGEAKGLLHLQGSHGELRILAYKNRLVQPVDLPQYVLGFAIDVTEQIHAEEQLRRLIRQSDSVLESTGDGIYGTDLTGRVTVVNPAAAKMLGYSREELLGRNMHELVHHSHPDGRPYPEAECPIQQSQKELGPVRVAHDVFWRKDGTSFPVEYIACPQIEQTGEAGGPEEDLPGAENPVQGRAVGVVVAFSDISERNALDRMKDEFISTVSHELRTPLTSLRAALGLVAAGRLSGDPERTQQMMDIAVDSTDRLVRLVNDILDLERIGSGKADMHFAECSVEGLFEQTAAVLQSAAARAEVRLTLQPNEVVVWADPDRLLQTLTNLVSNAIKFGAGEEPGTATEVVLAARYEVSGQVLLTVQDHGRGIPAAKLQVIFERFQQVDASDSRSMGGTGLGLAICRSIIAQHGGTIWATSSVGEGSTFHVLLPPRGNGSLR